MVLEPAPVPLAVEQPPSSTNSKITAEGSRLEESVDEKALGGRRVESEIDRATCLGLGGGDEER